MALARAILVWLPLERLLRLYPAGLAPELIAARLQAVNALSEEDLSAVRANLPQENLSPTDYYVRICTFQGELTEQATCHISAEDALRRAIRVGDHRFLDQLATLADHLSSQPRQEALFSGDVHVQARIFLAAMLAYTFDPETLTEFLLPEIILSTLSHLSMQIDWTPGLRRLVINSLQGSQNLDQRNSYLRGFLGLPRPGQEADTAYEAGRIDALLCFQPERENLSAPELRRALHNCLPGCLRSVREIPAELFPPSIVPERPPPLGSLRTRFQEMAALLQKRKWPGSENYAALIQRNLQSMDQEIERRFRAVVPQRMRQPDEALYVASWAATEGRGLQVLMTRAVDPMLRTWNKADISRHLFAKRYGLPAHPGPFALASEERAPELSQLIPERERASWLAGVARWHRLLKRLLTELQQE